MNQPKYLSIPICVGIVCNAARLSLTEADTLEWAAIRKLEKTFGIQAKAQAIAEATIRRVLADREKQP